MKTFCTKNLIKTALIVSFFIVSCHKDDAPVTPIHPAGKSKAANTYSGEFINNYFGLMCKVSKTTPGFFPPQVARAYGYVGVAAYEAVVNGVANAQSLGGQLNGLAMLPKPVMQEEYNWAISSNAAMAEMMKKMFDKKLSDANRSSIDSMETATLSTLSSGVSADIVSRSVQYGKDVATALYQYSTTDGGHESYLDPFQLPFSLPPDSFCWVPTGAVTTPISPHWGSNRPFLKSDVDNTVPAAHIAYSTGIGTDFYNQAMQVYNQIKNNTPDQIDIAKYWADDPFNTCTPTGHTFNILMQLLQENNATLEKASVAYAKLAIAENDAFIACWKGKYQYVLIRPVSYIKLHIDANFTTVIGTPPFPSYTSGHSCEIAAGAKVFTQLFTNGSGNYKFTDESQLQYGFMPRSYANFDAMAEECAISRFYGGIHYPMDNESGLICGKAVGDNVINQIRWPTNIK